MSDASTDLLEGYRLQTLGRREEAERLYRRVLTTDPENVHALNLLGIVCLESARPDEAVDLISRAVLQTPGDAEALANLALALKEVGRLEEASESLAQSLRHNPRNPVAHNNRGNILSALLRDAEAIACFRAALQLKPDYVECLINLGAALTSQGQLVGAKAAAERAVHLNPQSAEAYNCLGDVFLKQTQSEEAAESYRMAIRLRPNFAEAMIGLSAALKELGDAAGAENILREAIGQNPPHAPAHNSLGVLLEQKGDSLGAAAQFRQAIALAPKFAQARYQLAQLKDSALTDAEIDAIQVFFDDPATIEEDRAPLAFALACIHERAGEYNLSFRFLAIAQAIKAKAIPYDDLKTADFYGRIENVFATAMPQWGEQDSCPSPQPVFVLGMPRSGTTLTEQILASHRDIDGAGEMSLMEDTISEAARMIGKPFPECVPSLSSAQRAELGGFYLSRLRKRAAATRYIVDKTPMNFQYVGFIAAILPDARIIHCRRHPVDNCLSIFKLPFENAHSYAHGLEALGLHYKRYARLMAQWEKVVFDRMVSVNYEDVVADLERESRRLLDFLGLPFDESMLEYHKTRRLVKTPSASQVRRPIYKDSVAAWKRYETQLQPLIAALETELTTSDPRSENTFSTVAQSLGSNAHSPMQPLGQIT